MATATMVYNNLGRSGLKVSNICLGTMTFGESSWGTPGQSDDWMSHRILNRFVELGGNFVDTADMYGRGKSEEIVGKWLENRQARENMVVATKVCGNMGKNVNSVGLSRRHIIESMEDSLRRLRTDYVDLYQINIWDSACSLEETLRTLDDLVRCGKTRYVGVCNVTGWQMQKLVDSSEKLGLNPIFSLQQQYSLVSRESELEPFQVCKEAGIAVLPWSPLKGGLLSGKYKRGVKPTEGRLGFVAADETKFKIQSHPAWSTFDDKTFDIVEAAEDIAKKHGRTMAQVAIRWLLQKDVVPSVVIGARTLAQLEDNMVASSGWSLSREEMQSLDDISAPSVPYPYEMVYRVNKGRENRYLTDTYVRSCPE